MNFGDLQSYVLDRLNLSVNDTARVTQVKNLLNQEYLRLIAEEELNVAIATISISAGQLSGSLPAAATGIRTLRNNTSPMFPITEHQMMSYVASTAAGAVPGVPAIPFYYVLMAPMIIAVWPAPTATTTLTGLFVQTPAAMPPLVANTDIPSLMPYAFHDLLPELVIKRIAISEEALWPQNLGGEIADDLLTRFRAWNQEQQGQSGAVIPLVGYTR